MVFIIFAARRKTIMQELSAVQKCLSFLMFFNNYGRDSAWSNAKLLYFQWFYNDSASDTITSYDIPTNNAKYRLSKKLIIPYVFQTFWCFHVNSMYRIVKIPVVFIDFLKIVKIYMVEID